MPKIALYQQWRGNHKFYLNGRLMTGPNPGRAFATLTLITVIVLSSSGTVLADLFKYDGSTFGLIVNIIAYPVVCFAWFRATFSDPGTVPKLFSDEAGSGKQDQSAQSFWFIVQNGQLVKTKYCFTCQIMRPPRTVHC
jgi:palmitoyltransferase ZDHHC9/14/18